MYFDRAAITQSTFSFCVAEMESIWTNSRSINKYLKSKVGLLRSTGNDKEYKYK